MPLCSVLLFLSIQFFCCRKISFSADSIKLLPIYINNLLPLYLYLFKATTKEKKRLRDRPLFRERDGNEENAKVFKPTTVEKRPSTDKEMIFLFLFFLFSNRIFDKQWRRRNIEKQFLWHLQKTDSNLYFDDQN